MGAMALLMGGGGDTTSEDEDGGGGAEAEENAAPAPSASQGATSVQRDTAVGDANPAKPGKKKKKKKKGKKNREGAPHGADLADESQAGATEKKTELDELESTIREVKALYNEANVPVVPDAVAVAGAAAGADHLLVVEKRHLNPETEIRNMFGKGAAREATARRTHGRGGMPYRKTVLAAPKDTWPRFTKMGLQMRRDDDAECPGFLFVHSKEYQRVQMRFLAAVQTLDPAQISHLLEAYPSHIDSLLQLSEVMRMNGDSQTAADFVERALFCFEQAFHPAINFATGECRLKYVSYPNRGFFLALFRHVVNVGNRGCWRTAFELSKLLLALAPDEDPLAATLMIDYYAVRSGQFAWLMRLAQEWEDDHKLSWLPNMAYSIAFARRGLALDEATADPAASEAGLQEADELLTRAIVRFPTLVPLLANKCGATLRPDVLSHKLFALPRVTPGTSEGCVRLLEVCFAPALSPLRIAPRPHALVNPIASQSSLLDLGGGTLQVVYVERASTLWKPPAVLDWLQTNALAAAGLADQEDSCVTEAADRRRTHYRGIPRNILRHVFVSEFPETNALIPADPEMGAVLAHDPYPPKGHRTEYDELAAEMSSQAGHGVGALEMFLRSLIPGFETAVEQLAAQRQRQQRRGGGGAQAAARGDGAATNIQQWLGQMTEEMGVDNLLQALLAEGQDDGNPDAPVPDDFDID